jgi:hypothetical protein
VAVRDHPSRRRRVHRHLNTRTTTEVAGNDAQCVGLAALLARRGYARTVIFGGDVNRHHSCAPPASGPAPTGPPSRPPDTSTSAEAARSARPRRRWCRPRTPTTTSCWSARTSRHPSRRTHRPSGSGRRATRFRVRRAIAMREFEQRTDSIRPGSSASASRQTEQRHLRTELHATERCARMRPIDRRAAASSRKGRRVSRCRPPSPQCRSVGSNRDGGRWRAPVAPPCGQRQTVLTAVRHCASQDVVVAPTR